MEPINYRDALRRRWPVVAGARPGGGHRRRALFPVHVPCPPPRTQYEASGPGRGDTGRAPRAPTPSAAPVTPGPDHLLRRQPARSSPTPPRPPASRGSRANLEKEIIITASKKKKKKSLTPRGPSGITVKQPSAKRSAKLTNAFVTALGNYINQRLAAQHATVPAKRRAKVSNLENQLNNIEHPDRRPGSRRRRPRRPRRPRPPRPPPRRCRRSPRPPPPSRPTAAANSSVTTTTPPDTTTTTTVAAPASAIGRGRFFPGPGAARGQPFQPRPGRPSGAGRRAHLGLPAGAAEGGVNLKADGPTKSGIGVVQPALAGQAKKIPAKVSLLSHHSIRALLGLAGGAIIGIAVIFLLDALDKRIRSVARAQETLGFPCWPRYRRRRGPARRRLAGRSGAPAQAPMAPIFATFSEPGSAIAEAYRMLRTALLLEPMIGPGPAAGLGSPAGPVDAEAAPEYPPSGPTRTTGGAVPPPAERDPSGRSRGLGRRGAVPGAGGDQSGRRLRRGGGGGPRRHHRRPAPPRPDPGHHGDGVGGRRPVRRPQWRRRPARRTCPGSAAWR